MMRVFRAGVLIAAVLALSAAWNAGGPPISDLMEVRNLVTAREMAATGRWLLPTMNGALRIAKPPLPTWAAAAAGVPGRFDSLWALRLPTLLMALVGVAATVVYARRLGLSDTGALWAGLMLASMFLYARHARLATWDVPVHAFGMAAIAAYGETVARRRTRFAVLTAALVAASFLSKWPASLGVLVLPWAVSAAFVSRPMLAARRSDVVWIAALSVAGCAAWPAYVYLHEPARAAQMLLQETDALITRHVRPVWAYAGFPIFAGAWMPLVLAAISSPLFFKEFFARREVRAAYVWMVLTFILVSVMPSKKDRYLIPLLFPMAVLVAAWCEEAGKRALPAAARVLRAQVWCVGLSGVAALLIGSVLFGVGRITGGETVVAGLLVAGGLAGFVGIVRSRRPLVTRAMAGTLVMAACVMAAGWHVQDRLEPFDLPPQLGGVVTSTLDASAPVFVPDASDLYVVWAVGRPVRPYPQTAEDIASLTPRGNTLTAGWISTDPPVSDPALARLRALEAVPAVDQTQRFETARAPGWLYYSRVSLSR